MTGRGGGPAYRSPSTTLGRLKIAGVDFRLVVPVPLERPDDIIDSVVYSTLSDSVPGVTHESFRHDNGRWQ